MAHVRSIIAIVIAVGVCACNRPGRSGGTESGVPAVAGQSNTPDPSKDLAYVCPMDHDIRANVPGKCPRCGMQLVAGVPEPTEYHLNLTITPRPPRPSEAVNLAFEVLDPWKNNRVKTFAIVHEKLFHAFIISRDLQFFDHAHPIWDNGVFRYTARFPKPGLYRLLADFYPEGARPQLLNDTIYIAGDEAPPAPLSRDDSPKTADNLTVAVTVSPTEPVAGMTTQMRFGLRPTDGIERYLGAWGHMLVASDDLIDMIHSHPRIADGSPEMQFTLVFPRPRTYRMWVQFQRRGVVNTAHFDIPVQPAAPTHPD